jgi:sugar phosphate isomerase/epimerase
MTIGSGLCYNPAVRHALCVYPETADRLAGVPQDFELELQSFGLGGVRSPRDWRQRAAFYAGLVRRHPARRRHLHGPFLDLSYTSWDHLILEATRRRIRDTLELCRRLRPEHLVLHLRCPAYFCRAERMEPWVRAARAFWEPWLERFAALGVTVAFENVEESDPAPAIALLDALRGYPCGFCLDVGHAHAFTALAPRLWVERLGARIVHLHVHDNLGDDDRHLPPGQGNIDFPQLYESFRRHCPQAVLSLELESDAESTLRSLAWSRGMDAAGLGE